MKTKLENPTHAELAQAQAALDHIKINVLPKHFKDTARIEWVQDKSACVNLESEDEGSLPRWVARDPGGEMMGEGDDWRAAVDDAAVRFP